MYVIVAPQPLKGSLTAAEAGQAIALGVCAVFPEAHVDIIPVADGGDGTVHALVEARKGEIVSHTVTGPLGEPVSAFYGLLDNGYTAIIEMAASSGFLLVPPERRDPRITTTYGVGELILDALDRGCRRIIIGLGSSATNDGGAGMAQALGISLQTEDGTAVARGGAALASLACISLANLDSRLRQCTIEVASDVTIPLCGLTGASVLFGPQKGATPEMVMQLDSALDHYAQIIERDIGINVRDSPGAGAAGGLGAALIAFVHATIHSGAYMILEAFQFEEKAKHADLVITAEGQIDTQTALGKSLSVVAHLAKRHQLPVLALSGNLGENYTCAYDVGIDAIMPLAPGPITQAYSVTHAGKLMLAATERALRILRIGKSLQ